MTCIVGLEYGGKVYMGGDSASISGWDSTETMLEKVFILDNRFLIGYTSSFRMGQLLQYNLEVPVQDDPNDLKYLVTKFIPAVRECLNKNGYTKILNNEEEAGTFLLGYKSMLYRVGSDFQVNRSRFRINACGCGESFALAALRSYLELSRESSLYAIEAISFSLETAELFSAGVRGPFTILEL